MWRLALTSLKRPLLFVVPLVLGLAEGEEFRVPGILHLATTANRAASTGDVKERSLRAFARQEPMFRRSQIPEPFLFSRLAVRTHA
jgi:hypothetical protein